MKKVIQIVLVIAIIGLTYVLYDQIMTPLRFQKVQKSREIAVVDRLKDIRTAERAYKSVYMRYTGSFDTLVNFLIHDSLPFRKSFGSADDSLAVAKGLVKESVFYVKALDTLFGKKYSASDISKIEQIPHGDGAKFLLAATMFTTESKVVVPVFECKAPYKDFLGDVDKQELINLIDISKTLNKYPGLKVGAIDAANNDAGNWE